MRWEREVKMTRETEELCRRGEDDKGDKGDVLKGLCRWERQGRCTGRMGWMRETREMCRRGEVGESNRGASSEG